jgi:ubiquinone biosynthesis protein UbiJ
LLRNRRLLPGPTVRAVPSPLRSGGAGGAGSYNRPMLQALHDLLAPAAMARTTLVLNHVLASEPAATARLFAHAGRRIEIQPQGWPGLLPPLPRLAFVVTPAGLLDWDAAGAGMVADLTVRFDASNPALLAARAISGETPAVDIDGDAQLATDVNWLLQNLRWDIEADLERVMPSAAAHQLFRLGGGLARGVQAAVLAAVQAAGRFAPKPA